MSLRFFLFVCAVNTLCRIHERYLQQQHLLIVIELRFFKRFTCGRFHAVNISIQAIVPYLAYQRLS